MLKKLTAIVLIALLSVFCCVACAPEPVPPDMAQNLALPEPVPPESAPIESTPVPRAESFTTRPEKTRNAEIGCSFAFFLLAVSAFSMMGALSVCNQPGDDF